MPLGNITQSQPLWQQNISDIAPLIESRELSPIALTQMMLERIAHLDPQLHAFATIMSDQALRSAQKAEDEIGSGFYRGPLHGIPIAIKDLCYTKGVFTKGGSRTREDFVPKFDATVVKKLDDAGAVLLGKLNLTEGAMLAYHPDLEIPTNPWDKTLWAGASSSGSGVATAAGLCYASIGTDTGGSIRIPSAANGIVGIKPTYGRVSRHGILELAGSLDHVGPMARSVRDAATVLEAIAGFDPLDSTSVNETAPSMIELCQPGRQKLNGIRIGFDHEMVARGVDPFLVSSITAALKVAKDLGAEIVDMKLPEFSQALSDAWFAICSYEAFRAHALTYPSRATDYGPFMRDFLGMGRGVTDAFYEDALTLRGSYNQHLTSVLSTVDAVALPSGGVPFTIPTNVLHSGMATLRPYLKNTLMQFSLPANFSGVPTISLPCGASSDGIPHTVQFMGASLSEPMLIRIGHVYEQATDWHLRHPPAMRE